MNQAEFWVKANEIIDRDRPKLDLGNNLIYVEPGHKIRFNLTILDFEQSKKLRDWLIEIFEEKE